VGVVYSLCADLSVFYCCNGNVLLSVVDGHRVQHLRNVTCLAVVYLSLMIRLTDDDVRCRSEEADIPDITSVVAYSSDVKRLSVVLW